MDRVCRILHVVQSLGAGGMENGLVNVANSLPSARFDVHVCCLESEGVFAKRLPSSSQVIALHKAPGFSPAVVLKLRRLLGEMKPDLIHTHNLGPLIYSGLATRFRSFIPILHGEHSQLTEEERQPRRLRQRRILYRFCGRVHSVSHALHQQLLELGFPESKLTVLVNGVDSERFAPGDRARAKADLGINPNEPVIGIVARFGPFKGHTLLIEAFEQMGANNGRLLIVGDGGPMKATVHDRVAKSRCAERIHLAGFQEDPRPYYRALDLLVVPSSNEGLSNAVLEAMACATPVLASDACGNADVIEDGVDGFLGAMKNPPDVATRIQRLLGDRNLLENAGLRARQKIVANYSLARMAQNYADLYTGLIAGTR